jgi:hypothetical protein
MADQEIVVGEDQYPIYYPLEPRPFQLSGTPSGAAGAVARLSHAFANARHFVYGIRFSNFYDLPTGLDADNVAVYNACREWVDGDQTVTLDISQQSAFVNQTIQTHVTGKSGVHWHPFPVPFYIAGGNDFKVTVTRLTSYPSLLVGEVFVPILPSVGATLVCGVFRGELTTQPPRRRG